jgi:hypothetical protein
MRFEEFDETTILTEQQTNFRLVFLGALALNQGLLSATSAAFIVGQSW